MSEKPESSLQDQQSNNTVAGIPIKKRLLAWTKSVSPPSRVVSCKTEGSESSGKNPILSETDPAKMKAARKLPFEPAIDIRPIPPGCQHEAVGRGGLNLVSGHDKEAGKIQEPTIDNRSIVPQGLLSEFRVPSHLSAGEGNTEDKVILNTKPALPGTCKIEEPAIDSSSMVPQEKVRAPSYLSAVKGNADGQIISNSDSTWQGASKSTVSTGTSLGHPLMEDGVTPPSAMLSGLFNDGQHLDGISVKVEKTDSCPHGLTLVGQYSQLKRQSDSEKAKSCHKNRLNWDLNTVMEAWEGSSGELSMNHEDANDLGLVDKCSLAGVHTEANRTDPTVGQSSAVDTDHNPNLSTLALSTREHFSPYTGLDLQLRPPCQANLGLNLGASSHLAGLNSIAEMSELSLSLSGNADFDATGSGKSKSFDGKSQNTTKEVNLNSMEIIGSQPVKREPCAGKFHEAPNLASSSNMKSATSSNSKITSASIVKPEPRDEPPQQCCEEPIQLLYGEFDKNNSVSSDTYVAEKAKATDSFSDHAKIGLDSGITTSADNTSSVTAGVVGMDMNLPSQSLAPGCGTAHYSGGVQNDANESCNENRVLGETFPNLLDSAVAQGKDAHAACEAFGLAAVTSSLPLGRFASDDKGSITTNDLSSVIIGTTGSNDDKLATHKTSAVENNEEKNSSHQFDKSSHHGITETDEQKVCGEVSDAVLGVNELKTHKSGDVDGIKKAAPKEGERDEFEDGEVRDPTLHGEGGDRVLPGEDSSEKREANQLDGSSAVVDVPLKMLLDEGVSEIQLENPEESENVDDSLCADERDSCISTADNQQELSAVGCLNVTTSKKEAIKTTQRFTVNNMVNEKGCETKSIPKRDALAHVDKGRNDKTSSTPENSKRLDMISEKHLPKKDASLKVNLGKQESGKEKQSRIIRLTSAIERSSHGKVKSNDNKYPMMQSEEDKMTDRPVMRSKPYSRETRDGFFKDRYQKFSSERNQDQYSGKHRSDLIRMKERANTHPDGSHYIKNMEAEHVFHRFKKSTGMRYPRHNNSSEIAYIAPDCRVVRKHGEDESSNLSRLPSRRRSPGPVDREGHPVMGVQVAGRSFISPGRCIGREIPDSLQLSTDEKRMRTLPDVMGDFPLRTQHRLQFEREENAFIRRERRSLSPRPRRGIPLRFRNECSPRQWSPPRRSPNMYEGHPELGHIRSPPILTHDRMRSPRQRPCFPEDVIVRRPGSPQSFMTRMPDDARELHLRRNDCMRPDRVLERNMQRFDMIDPRETTEEEYLEHLHYNQFCELAGGDERVDVRRICEERRGFVRPIRQRFNASEDEGSLHNHAGDGPPTFRFRPEAMEGFSERGGSRDFSGHIQSRLGNVHDRLHGVDEREQYHGRQGWLEADFADVRPKRRRM